MTILEIRKPSESERTSPEELDSVVLYHCDDKKLFETLQVLQFLPPCKVGALAVLYFADDSSADEDDANGEYSNDWNAVEDYVACMKKLTRLARNRQELPGNQRNKASNSSLCKKFLEQNEKLKFQFKWVYFKDLTQYLIPFGAVIGTLMLAAIIGTIWDCVHTKKINECATKTGNRVNNA